MVLLGRVGGRAGEPPDDPVGAEPVVAVPVGGVDVGQPLAGPLDPVAHPVDLVVGEWRVDEDAVRFSRARVAGQGAHADLGCHSGSRMPRSRRTPSLTKTT